MSANGGEGDEIFEKKIGHLQNLMKFTTIMTNQNDV